MKKFKFLLLTTLLLLITTNVDAKIVEAGGKNYVVYDKFYCDSLEVNLEVFIEKTGKIEIAYNNGVDEVSYMIWNDDNTCTPITSQDYLDESNSKRIYYYPNTTYSIKRIDVDGRFLYAAVPAYEGFNPNEQYYIPYHHGQNEVVTPEENKYDTYYVRRYIRQPLSSEVDSNKIYYTEPYYANSSSSIASDVDEDTIKYYYVVTTLDELNYKETILSVDETFYDSGIPNADDKEILELDGQAVIKATLDDGTIKYFDENNNEIVKYRNYHIYQNENFTVYKSSDRKKVIVYDKDSTNIIYEKELTEADDYITGIELTITSVVVNSYVNYEDKTAYINVYNLLEGDNQTFTKDDLVLRFNGNYNAFNRLIINDEVVPTDKYTVTEGSTIITLKKDYLNTLDNGDYTLKVVYNDGGTVSTTFKVDKNTIDDNNEDNDPAETNPNTLDSTTFYIIITLVSLSGLALIYKKIS